MADIKGTPNSDPVTYGTPYPDTIDMLTGNDEVYGGLGDDTIIGGPEDPVAGYTDNDLIFGDTFRGEASNDKIYGGYGNDTLYGDSYEGGGGGNDTIYGGLGDDKLFGGDGNDFLDGGAGNDSLYGGTGDDYLDGGTGADVIYGGDGKDYLSGSDFPGVNYADTLYGGGGDDQYYIGPSDVVIENASEGIDTVTVASNYTLGANVENLTFTGGSSTLIGTGNSLDNYMWADTATPVYLYGLAGNDTLVGNDSNDTLDGGDGNDRLYGGFYGDDYLNGRSGADTMTGGLGNDTYVVDNIGDVVVEKVAEGVDTIVSSVDYTLGTNIEKLTLTDSAVNGTGNELDNYILGNAVDNYIFTKDGNDTVNGRGGNDYINGGVGNDTLYGDTGNDYLYGDIGNDLFYGGDGNDTLLGAAGNDFFYGQAGNDILIGGNGTDTLYGGTGADQFRFDLQSDGLDTIKDFNRTEGDKIAIFKSSFGATSLSQFSYNSTTGALLFDASPSDGINPIQLATLENKPAGFSVQTDIVLV